MKPTRMLPAVVLATAAVLSFDASAATPPSAALDPVPVTAARTKADHEAVAAAYETEAEAAERKAQMHATMAARYRDFGMKPPWSGMSSHCAQLKTRYREAAKLNRELAAEHHRIAATLP